MSDSAEIRFVVRDGVGEMTIDRPARKNALTVEMIDAIRATVENARTDRSVRVLTVTGAGDAFCSGVDLEMMRPAARGLEAPPLAIKELLSDHIQRIALAIEDLGKPVIAAVNGSAIGAGMDLALMCDLRIAGASARFAEAYVRAGIVPGAGGCYLLPRIVGRPRALELLLTGDMIDAAEADRIGLVNRVVDDDLLASAARELAVRIAASSPVAVSTIRRATLQSERCDLRTSLDLISSHLAVVSSTADVSEAIGARQEKRTPQFTGE